MAIDVITLDYVLQRLIFPVELAGRVVLDAGAHKGYWGALALMEGATAVYSFEPESSNYEAMERAVVKGRDSSSWVRRKLAVGAVTGEVEIHVSTESWAHSVYLPDAGTSLGVQKVDMISFESALAELSTRHPDASLVLKLNVEGAAGDCLLSVSPSELSVFDELLVDIEDNTPQSPAQILSHIEAGGFELVGSRESVYHFTRCEP